MVTCRRDADCTEGNSGRCVATGPLAVRCSARTIRASAIRTVRMTWLACAASRHLVGANSCVSAQYRADADCGACGFCSPSSLVERYVCPSASLCRPDVSCSRAPACVATHTASATSVTRPRRLLQRPRSRRRQVRLGLAVERWTCHRTRICPAWHEASVRRPLTLLAGNNTFHAARASCGSPRARRAARNTEWPHSSSRTPVANN